MQHKLLRHLMSTTIILTFVLGFMVYLPSNVSLANDNHADGINTNQEGLSEFQRTHSQLVNESRASTDTGNAVDFPRAEIKDAGFTSSASSSNGTTSSGINIGPSMLTGSTAFESFDLNTVVAIPGTPAGFTPPDTMGAVGPTQFATIQNGAYRWHDKVSGAVIGALDVSAAGFWPASVDPNNDAGGDPRVRYDRLTDTWVISAFTRTTPNTIVLAVSDGPVISVATVWTYWFINPAATLGGQDTGASCFADYPTLGVDSNAYMIGNNMFSCTGGTNTTAWVIPKGNLPGAGGDASSVTHSFNNLFGGCGGAGACVWTPTPADSYEANANSYFIGQHANSDIDLMLGTVTYPGGVPSLSWQAVAINDKNDGYDNGVPYPGVPAPTGVGTNWGLDPLGFRPIGGAIVRNGSLWTTVSSSVDGPAGALQLWPTTGDRHSVVVFEINVGSGTTIQDFNIYDDVTIIAGNPTHYWMGTVSVNGQGHMVTGFTAANTTSIAPSAAWSGQLASDPVGSFTTPVIYWPGTDTGNVRQSFETGARRTRWGDYSMTTIDPCDDQSFYTIQEFQDTPVGAFGGNWAVAVGEILAPPPIATTATDVSSPLGSVISTVTGTDFFDTDATTSAFCRQRITATSGDPNVVINGINYLNSTTVELDLDTTAATCPSTVTITIANPDGQTTTVDVNLVCGTPTPTPVPNPTVVPGPTSVPGPTVSDPGIAKSGTFAPGEVGLPGDVITWTITVSNPTGQILTNIVVSDTLSSELRIDDATTTSGSVNVTGQTVTTTIPSLSPGQTVTIQIVTTVLGSPAGGVFVNTTSLTADGGLTASASASLSGVSGLPATGYAPTLRW